MEKRRVVVTGIGVVNPAGVGKELFWDNVSAGKSAIKKITRFDPKETPIKIAGEIDSFSTEKFVPKRVAVKTDLFTHYALAATEMAISDAGLEINSDNEYDCGIFFGNNSGGWDICERGFYELYNDGATYVNPWQATAWFPTAPQGYIAIKYGIKGYSKTFVADRVSGSSAIYFGLSSILNGTNSTVVAGGTEAPLSAFGTFCYHETGEMSTSSEPNKGCHPFDKKHSGIVLGEGSAVMVLQELEEASKGEAEIYGEITGWAMNVGKPDDVESLTDCMSEAIKKSGLTSGEIDLIIPEGNGNPASDHLEAEAIGRLFGKKRLETLPVCTPKALFGHLYGAATPLDLACALLTLKTGKVPPAKNYEAGEIDSLNIVAEEKIDSEIDNILINSRSREGVNITFVVSRYK